VSQFEQENDLGRGGGEVDEETLEDAWKTAKERLGAEHTADDEAESLDEAG
jgi:hypothetical protein